MTKKKQTPKTIPASKVDTPKAYGWTKSQKALYKEITGKAQASAGEVANVVLKIYNDVLGTAIDTFAEELGISDDGFDYDADAQKFRFVRRAEPKAE